MTLSCVPGADNVVWEAMGGLDRAKACAIPCAEFHDGGNTWIITCTKITYGIDL